MSDVAVGAEGRSRARGAEVGGAPARRGGRPSARRSSSSIRCSVTRSTRWCEHDDLHDAIASASPEVAGLLRRVTVEEPLVGDPEFGDPVDLVVGVLLREAVRRALSEVEKASRGLGESWQAGAAVTAQVRHWLAELDDPGSVRAAADRLVAWLMEREPKEG